MRVYTCYCGSPPGGVHAEGCLRANGFTKQPSGCWSPPADDIVLMHPSETPGMRGVDFTDNLKDRINPAHYRSHPSGVECIQVTRHMSFNLGNVVKYLWRAGLKDGAPTVEDLKKARWYLEDEINRMGGR